MLRIAERCAGADRRPLPREARAQHGMVDADRHAVVEHDFRSVAPGLDRDGSAGHEVDTRLRIS